MTKNLWRQGLVACPAYCAHDTPQADCVCGAYTGLPSGATSTTQADAPLAELATLATQAARGNGTAAYMVLERAGMFKWIIQYTDQLHYNAKTGRYVLRDTTSTVIPKPEALLRNGAAAPTSTTAAAAAAASAAHDYATADETDVDVDVSSALAEDESAWAAMYLALTNPQLAGEMYTSAAPWDPLFWLVHPTAERMLQYRRLAATRKRDWAFGEVWGYAHDSRAPSDTRLVCDWSRAANADVSASAAREHDDGGGGLGVTAALDYDLPMCAHGATCSGHAAADLLPMDIEGRMMSNLEFWQYMNPLNGSLPYVYDNFHWAHCDAQGFDFFNYGR